jgi:glycosidase
MLSGYLQLQDTLPGYRWSPFLSNHDGTRVMTLLRGDMARAKIAATLLLTLPGLPFVYYGEEIGMSGDKPDPRLRTPMQWSAGHAAGFTTGTPWETLQPDTQAINVTAEDADPNSLLNLYRRLIKLRRSNDALATGRLVPLTTGSAEVIAYLRRAGDKAVLVVANLGATAVAGVSVHSGNDAIPPGSYAAHGLLGTANGATLVVGSNGQLLGYVPLTGRLGPRESAVFDMVRQ